MAALLVALGSCSEALELVPLLAACTAAGEAFEVAWFGSAGSLADARGLGLRGPVRAIDLPLEVAPASRIAAAAIFTAALLEQPWSAVVLAGHGSWAPGLGSAARAQRLPVLRLSAGVRTHRGPTDAARRLADFAADAFAVASDWQRQELLREGADGHRIFVVGRLLAGALPAAPAPETRSGTVVCLEHTDLGDARWPARWQALQDGADGPLLALPTKPWHQLQSVPQPHGIQLMDAADATAQLQRAMTARCLVTDSAGYQELAALLGIPCVSPAEHGALPELLASHRLALFEGPDELQRALAMQLARPQPPLPSPDAAAGILAALRTLRTPPSVAAAAKPLTLPSDGDASGRTLGADEIALAAAAIRRGTLNSTRGTFVTTFERQFAQWLGRKHAIACASGSAAMHVAIACLGLQPGDEVITTPITDMGALTPIFYEGAVPVFADVDPRTLNVTAATIAAQITDRTRAIVATHLFGLPCELAAIMELAAQRSLPIIEDTAQAFGAVYRQQKVGTFGRLAAFSLQQGKHITTGEGGIVATDDDALARRAFLYVNKAWGYGDPRPDHYFPALNYRLTELQGAVALAQLPKLDGVVAARRTVASALQRALADVPGLLLPRDPETGAHSWWKFAFQVDPGVVPGGAQALGKRMQQAGIACVPRYIQKPAFECELFRTWRSSPVTAMPLQHSTRAADAQPFGRGDYRGARQGLDQVVVLPINERYTAAHIEQVAAAIAASAAELRRG